MTTATRVTRALRPGETVRRFRSEDFRTVAAVLPAGGKGASVAFTDGTSVRIGRDAEWQVTARDDEGLNLDPAFCDCGKGAYCPLWDCSAAITLYGRVREADRERIAGSEA